MPNMANVIRGLELKGSLGYLEVTVITRVLQYAREGRRAQAKKKCENGNKGKQRERGADEPGGFGCPSMDGGGRKGRCTFS